MAQNHAAVCPDAVAVDYFMMFGNIVDVVKVQLPYIILFLG